MDNLDHLKKRLKDKLPEKGISHVLQSLKGNLSEESSKYNLLINLESEHKEFHLKFLGGLLSEEVIKRTNADIRNRLMKLIDELEATDFDKIIQKSNLLKEQTYKKGHVLYHIPKKMQAFKETRCRVRIAFDKKMLSEGLDFDVDMRIKSEVRISDKMKVEIIDPTNNNVFEIRSTSGLTQLIDQDDFTEWKFYVKPLLAGEHILELKVHLIVFIRGEEVVREKTLEESVVIIAEEVKETEMPFEKMMDGMVVLNTRKISQSTSSLSSRYPILNNPNPIEANAPIGSSLHLPIFIKNMAIGFLALITMASVSYAFIPPIQAEIDWFIAHKIRGNEASYIEFLNKYGPNVESSAPDKPKNQSLLETRVNKAQIKVDKFEWEKARQDPTGKLIKDYLEKDITNGVDKRYESEATLILENIEWRKIILISDTLTFIDSLKKFKIRFREGEKFKQADSLLQTLYIDQTKVRPNEIPIKFDISLLRRIEPLTLFTIQQLLEDQKTQLKIKGPFVFVQSLEMQSLKHPIIIADTLTKNKSIANFTKSYFTDSRDGQIYPTVFINGRWWMAKNLNIKTANSYCYDNFESNCHKYGRLYTWEAANTACPRGWHLPSDHEWSEIVTNKWLERFLVMADEGPKRKWEDHICHDCSEILKEGGISGFSALFSGFRKQKKSFKRLGKQGYYWSSTRTDQSSRFSFIFSIYRKSSGLKRYHYFNANNKIAIACRCVKN